MLETSQNHFEFLIEEDAFIFYMPGEHLPIPFHFTPGAHPSATSQEGRSRSSCGIFRTDVPSSQYTGNRSGSGA